MRTFRFIRQLLGTDGPDTGELNGTFTFRRRRPDINRKFIFTSFFVRKFHYISYSPERSTSVTGREENLTDNDDEILESLVKTATRTATPRTVQRERKRTRNADRKSCKFFILISSFPGNFLFFSTFLFGVGI